MRLLKIREALISKKLDAFIVTSSHNRYYATNFSGSSGVVLITLEDAYLITDSRYKEQATGEVFSGIEVEMYQGNVADKVSELLIGKNIKTIGFEGKDISYFSFGKFSESLYRYSLVSRPDLFEELRQIKDDDEIEKIRKACEMGDEVFTYLLDVIKPGVSERHIAIELEKYLLERGLHTSFATIVASGIRGAMPHASISDKVIEVGDLVTLDFGCIKDHYVSDMTRTVVIGNPNAKQKEIYDLVYSAQMSAIASIKPGILAKTVDDTARNIIKDAGFAANFGHGLGHGVGLEVHELPTLSPLLGEERTLKPGMVFSIEPGIYISGWGGVRIEDLVVLKDTGPEILTKSTKKLIQL